MFFWKIILLVSWLGVSDDSLIKKNNDSVRINQLQFLGSHNSYRIKNDALWNELNRWKHLFTKMMVTRTWNYSHQPFDTQLSVYGLRSLELDIYYDPDGGRFYRQKGNKKIKTKVDSGIEDLKKPGLKVMHVPDYDYQTHHYLFKDALQKIKDWSDKNPGHEPLFIFVEMKDLQFMKYFFPFKCSKVLKFSKAAVDSIDHEINAVFGENSEKIITPDKFRGEYATVKEAVTKRGWPILKNVKGKIFFVLMGANGGIKNYLAGHKQLQNRSMFVFTNEKDDNAAFIKLGNPLKHFKEIQSLVKKGFMVRTRSDAGTREARKEKYERFEAALKSGAQIISTDYYAGDQCFLKKNSCSPFKVGLADDKIFRNNPVFFPNK